jgi:hypothetical protein
VVVVVAPDPNINVPEPKYTLLLSLMDSIPLLIIWALVVLNATRTIKIKKYILGTTDLFFWFVVIGIKCVIF